MKSEVKKKIIGITLAIIIMASLLTGCGEHAEENRAEKVKEFETETGQTDDWTENPTETDEELQVNCGDAEEMILLSRIIDHEAGGTSYVEREYEYDSSGNRTRELIYHPDGDIGDWREWEYDVFGNLVKEKEYSPSFSAADWPEDYWCERAYDLSGNLIRETWYDFDGGIDERMEYEYDESGNPTKKVCYDADGNVEYQVVWEYDEFGNHIMESHSTYWIEWKYDSPENPTHETETQYWDGKVDVKYERFYASTGSLTREIHYYYNEDGSIRWGGEYEYDSFGNKITYIHYKENGSTDSRFEWEYDSFGNMLTEIIYRGSGSISRRREWEYDSPENPTKETTTYYNADGSIIGWDECEYDAFGNRTKKISYDADGYVEVSGWMEWERDEYGNTTKEIQYSQNGRIVYWREFEYITLTVIAEEDLYDEFLNGERCVGDADIYYFITPTGEPDRRYATDYIIIDSTGDGIPELHLRTAREYTIFSCVDDELVVIQSFFSNRWDYSLTDKGAFIFRTDTGTTMGDFYRYFEMDSSGNPINEVTFEWTDINENLICDENDEFIYNNRSYTKEEWYQQTKEYLFIDEEGRYQIRDRVEWIRYCDRV